MVYTSHLLHEVELLCDEVVFLNNGKVVANELLNIQKPSLNFTTVKPLSPTQITLFTQPITILENGGHQLKVSNSEQLASAFIVLANLSHDIKTLTFSNSHIEQLYRDLFSESSC